MFDLRARPEQRFSYLGYALLVTDALGRVGGHGIEGFYVENTRVLSRLTIEVDGVELAPFAASGTQPGEFLSYAAIAPSETVPEDSVYVETCHRLCDDVLTTTIVIANWSLDTKAGFDLRLGIDSDFGDIEDIEADRPCTQSEVSAAWDDTGQTLELRS